MSAFLVSKKHIDAIITFGFEHTHLNDLTPTEAGQILWTENQRAVNHRYNRRDRIPVYTFERYRFNDVGPVAAQVFKALICLDYECDDLPKNSAAYLTLTRELKDRAGCHQLGYDAAAWEIQS